MKIIWFYNTLNTFKKIILYTSEVFLLLDHIERKVPKYEYPKIRERKVKTLTRNWSDNCRTGTRKHTESVSKYFDGHGCLSQSEESKCLWTHDKDGVTREFMKGATRGLREEWMEGNYLRLMPAYFYTVFVCLVLQWFLQFLVRVFTFLSLILGYSYFGTFLSTWSNSYYYSIIWW